jgi:uncharacterized protein
MAHALSAHVRDRLPSPLPPASIDAVLTLLDGGATVPFIARYRKERTGALDEVAIRDIAAARDAAAEFLKRRDAIEKALAEAGALSPELAARLAGCTTRAALEDLYLPFRKKRKTRASAAREAGLGPLADALLRQDSADPTRLAARYVGPNVPDVAAALAGARDIAAEALSERADLRHIARTALRRHARIVSKAVKAKTDGVRTPYEAYYAHGEPASRAPSHRVLAMLRGERDGFLRLSLELDDARLLGDLLRASGQHARSPFAPELEAALADGYKRLLRPQLDTELLGELKASADEEAVRVFAANLESLLLAPPLGPLPVVGLDPGFRTGVKVAVVNAAGAVAATDTLQPHAGSSASRREAADRLRRLADTHRPVAIAIGNGTASRETEAFVREALAELPADRRPLVVSVSETGASVYSASDLARAELPGLDVTLRGAVSIARRLQDPLAELVKVEPQALGVGQYQHDVDPKLLSERLRAVVETAVNRVGVDLNTASPALLQHVAGIGPALAERIVAHRGRHGPFAARAALRDVEGLGPKRFEQAAGFLRIRGGAEPLDASAVHPERYDLVARMARDLGRAVADLIGQPLSIDLARYVDTDVGLPTLTDIAAELARPGRDPRSAFEAPAFRDDIRSLDDLTPGLELEGVVTNVTAFGAFVDIGVHQDGLVHISRLSDGFVRDPHAVVRAGDRVEVIVVDVDRSRRRIGLARRIR